MIQQGYWGSCVVTSRTGTVKDPLSVIVGHGHTIPEVLCMDAACWPNRVATIDDPNRLSAHAYAVMLFPVGTIGLGGVVPSAGRSIAAFYRKPFFPGGTLVRMGS